MLSGREGGHAPALRRASSVIKKTMPFSLCPVRLERGLVRPVGHKCPF